jgi:hypothetical protein
VAGDGHGELTRDASPSGRSARRGPYAGVTPNGETARSKNVGGVKVFHLVAMPVQHELAPGLAAEA